MMTGISKGEIAIKVKRLPGYAKPALVVEFKDDPTRSHKVASFDSEYAAHWFLEMANDLFLFDGVRFSSME